MCFEGHDIPDSHCSILEDKRAVHEFYIMVRDCNSIEDKLCCTIKVFCGLRGGGCDFC